MIKTKTSDRPVFMLDNVDQNVKKYMKVEKCDDAIYVYFNNLKNLYFSTGITRELTVILNSESYEVLSPTFTIDDDILSVRFPFKEEEKK